MPYSLSNKCAKSYHDPTIFVPVIVKDKVACLFVSQCMCEMLDISGVMCVIFMQMHGLM